MDEQDVILCFCGRTFVQDHAYGKHQRYCQKSKKRLSGAFDKAKAIWQSKKQKRLHITESPFPSHSEIHVSEMAVENRGTTTALRSLPEASSNLQGADARPQSRGEPMEIEHEEPLMADDSLSLAERRSRRQNRLLPKRYRDLLPQPAPSLLAIEQLVLPAATAPDSPPVLNSDGDVNSHEPSLRSRACQIFRTPRNIFGIVRQYFTTQLPIADPEELITLEDLSSADTSVTSSLPHHSVSTTATTEFYPFPNKSSFLLGDWYWNGGVQKSQQSLKDLIDIVGDPSFDPSHVRHTKWDRINAVLAADADVMSDAEHEWLDEDAGWMKTRVKISVPFHRRMRTPGVRDYFGAELYHRSLVDVIKERITDPHTGARFHMEPYKLLWQAPHLPHEVKLHGELYTSQAFLDAHHALQDSPGEPGCDLPRVVVALMFWSDSTHLTSFGNSHLWPLYLFIGNESKYRRCKPSCNLCSHVAYFEKLPDDFKDFATEHIGGSGPKKAFFTHCRREFFHEQVKVILDDTFIEAFKHGIVAMCYGGIQRRFYPRIFTYSADYPEKVILACIRNMGICPCPRCLIPKDRFRNLGMARDRQQRLTLARNDDQDRRFKIADARRIIYEKNYAVNSRALDKILLDQSLVPTSNAFSDKLHSLGFNLFSMLVVDLMHEFKLGVWKALLIHLLRILMSVSPSLLHELDCRYRQVPTFGRDTIRRFRSNVSELKKMAARDFEDLLQCAIPVFEGLLPEPHNSIIMRLLFTCAHWHGLAKLRMHSDITLDILDNVTTALGERFRHFQRDICPSYGTRELPREANARRRRCKNANGPGAAKFAPLNKNFNLDSYKYHSLGDYVRTIRRLGTTDSFSTTVGELEHRRPKGRYVRTDRRKNFVKQLTQIERRQARIRRIKQKLGFKSAHHSENVSTTPEVHHHIGLSEKYYEHIGTFLRTHSADPAVKDFLPKLKEHLLPRIQSMLTENSHQAVDGVPAAGTTLLSTPAGSALDHVLIKHDRIYCHNLMRVNYTTDDIRRKQDNINPATPHHNIIVLADNDDDSDDHPFLYARVIGIFHANVIYTGYPVVNYRPCRIEFLWVRWYEFDPCAPTGGWARSVLDRLRFPPMASNNAFGFLDPADVVRAAHIIPRFFTGKRYVDGEGLSRCAKDSNDWHSYFVNRFVDRDMLMRYHWGLGVGHVYTHQRFTKHGVLWPHTKNQDTETDTHEALDAREDNFSEQEFCHNINVNAEIQADQRDSDSADSRSEDDGISESGDDIDGEKTDSDSQDWSNRDCMSDSSSDQDLLELEETYDDILLYDEYED